jgi:hypothetical protein
MFEIKQYDNSSNNAENKNETNTESKNFINKDLSVLIKKKKKN